MAKTETSVTTLKINRGTYANIQSNLSSIGENELIITTDKSLPVPSSNDSGKIVSVNSSGEYELTTATSGASAQDLTENTAGTLDSTAWSNLKTNHYATITSPTMTGLSSSYDFVDIKLSINSNNQIIKLVKNTTNKYSGLFFIEESTHLYEITAYYNGTNIILRCATVY